MKPRDLAAVRWPGTPTLSPDGHLAVVALRRLDLDADGETSQLWAVAVDGSAPPRQLTFGWADDDPRFSPDGQWLAFTRRTRERDDGRDASGRGSDTKRQLYVLPLAGGEPRRLTEHPLGIGPPAWSPDSTRLAYAARVPEDGRYGPAAPEKEPPRRITRLLYRVDGEGFLLDRPRQVFVLDAHGADPQPVQMTAGGFDHGDPHWSPDGQWLTFEAARHDTAHDDRRSDVWICRPDGTDLRALTDGTLAARDPHVTPDGAAVCFLAVEAGLQGRDVVMRSAVAWSVPMDGSAPARRLLDEQRYQALHPGGKIIMADDGVLFPNERRGAVELLLVPYDGGEPRLLVGGHRQVRAGVLVGTTLVAAIADSHCWGELYTAAPAASAPAASSPAAGATAASSPAAGATDGLRQLTHWSAPFAADVGVYPQEELTAHAPDGYEVHGWVVRPDGDGPHPVLLMIHGGPYAQYGWELFDEAQVYAGAGYAVVMGNPRGSAGYGEAHGRAVMGNVGELSAVDLLALLDAALSAPDLDASRVGVLGGSHGGYMTTWLAAHHGNRFRAAISERAVNAIDSFEGSSDIGWFFADSLYGTDPERRRAQSPLTYADRIDIPMLLIHSEQDWRCPIEQAQRLYVALKRRGVPVEMLLFPGEGHELSRSGLPSHRIARFEAILDWWARHL